MSVDATFFVLMILTLGIPVFLVYFTVRTIVKHGLNLGKSKEESPQQGDNYILHEFSFIVARWLRWRMWFTGAFAIIAGLSFMLMGGWGALFFYPVYHLTFRGYLIFMIDVVVLLSNMYSYRRSVREILSNPKSTLEIAHITILDWVKLIAVFLLIVLQLIVFGSFSFWNY